ncbi:hypothetical protein Plim_2137 [Planctopirus limnophila DSM 3776]|uniref:Metal dependent phosphohydrolase n=1 Tax=Planctopirus limnophila (strain ATCC 43296 / DSM 3776 / IFAM 1008 / Mu 290) TaxID=521674 RepID=D5SMQ9_PLAL2|nr:hypothetical protein [Planctopirus limnophila]ADG67964.1 hypothetical protein Plim_2137 [Planctopirus limnophila DSM 3776]
MTWIQTYSGKRVDLLDPQPHQIHIDDIAHALSVVNRFNGHTRRAYSVAEHSIFVCNQLPRELQLAGLLHDAAEAYLGDVTRPLKALIADIYKPIENRFNEVIGQKFSVDPKHFDHPLVHAADLLALASERHQLMRTPCPHEWEMELPDPVAIDPSRREPGQVYVHFMQVFHACQ